MMMLDAHQQLGMSINDSGCTATILDKSQRFWIQINDSGCSSTTLNAHERASLRLCLLGDPGCFEWNCPFDDLTGSILEMLRREQKIDTSFAILCKRCSLPVLSDRTVCMCVMPRLGLRDDPKGKKREGVGSVLYSVFRLAVRLCCPHNSCFKGAQLFQRAKRNVFRVEADPN